jgi:membrane peptidoglycan carboxypeptidase
MSEHRRKPPRDGGRPGPDVAPQGRAARRRAASPPSPGRRAEPAPGCGRADRRRAAQQQQSPRRRFIDYPRWGKRGVRRWLPSWRQVLGTFLFVVASGLGVGTYAYATIQIPSPNPSTQQQSNIFYWSDGSVMATKGAMNRQNVELSQVPPLVKWDFLAAENATFYTDSGVDYQGMLRAVYHMVQGGEVQSGSTITQQFVKNTYLTQNQSITRKFKEILISLKIGNQMSKDQILQGYLNSNYYGRGAYGIEAAARAYYHVHASQLNISQGAFLTATVNEPSVMMLADSDPKAKAQAEGRWQYVLHRMVVIHQISQAQYDQLMQQGFPTPKPYTPSARMNGQTGYLVDTAEQYVKAHANLTDAQFNHGGYQIYTTFNKNKVQELAASVDAMRKKNLNPDTRPVDKNVQVGAASVDPSTGALVAIYGGAGFDKGHWTNNADTVGVPVGSTFKPVDLSAALEHGAVLTPGAAPSPITPDSKFNGDDGIEIKNQEGHLIPDGTDPTGFLHQQNDDNTKWGYITLRKAMINSVNTPYVQLGEYVGYDHVEKMAEALGLPRKSLQYDTAGFYIGTSTPNAMDMAGAYATFDNHGVHHDVYSVGKVVFNGAPMPGFTTHQGNQVMASTTADAVTNVLKDVVDQGTGANAKALGRPAAGKTGTTDDYKSAWFVGYTPQLVTSVTMFKEKPNGGLESMAGVGGEPKVYGANMPTDVWLGYMQAALAGQPVKDFPPMPDLGKGVDENGAPAPSASPSVSASPSPNASASTSPSPSASTPCRGRKRKCVSPGPSASSTDGSTTGGGWTGGGLLGGTTGGGSTTSSPTPTSTFGGPGNNKP